MANRRTLVDVTQAVFRYWGNMLNSRNSTSDTYLNLDYSKPKTSRYTNVFSGCTFGIGQYLDVELFEADW